MLDMKVHSGGRQLFLHDFDTDAIPLPRTPPLTVGPNTCPVLWPALLGLRQCAAMGHRKRIIKQKCSAVDGLVKACDGVWKFYGENRFLRGQSATSAND